MKSQISIAGCVLATAVLISACGANYTPTATESGGNAVPSAASSAEPVTQALDETVLARIRDAKLGAGYDVEAATLLGDAKEIALALDKGAIRKPATGDAYSFISYDGAEKWSVAVPGSPSLHRIVWDDKEYVVFSKREMVKGDSSGISKVPDAAFNVELVHDAVTGKLVKEHRTPDSDSDPNVWTTPQKWNFDPGYNGQNGLLYMQWKNFGGSKKTSAYRTMNPVTGEVIKEITVDPAATTKVVLSGVTSTGDFVLWKGSMTSTEASVTIPGVVEIPNVRDAVFTGEYLLASVTSSTVGQGKVAVYDGGNGKLIAEMAACGGSGGAQTTTSANGRFLIWGNAAVDTETGKAFCGVETETQKGLNIAVVDNKGNVYGESPATSRSTEFGYQVNIVDGTSSPIGKLPVAITRDQIGVFVPGNEGYPDKAFAVPLTK